MSETASVLTARVSSICDYAWWKTSGLEWDWFVNKDRGESDRMKAGTALHDALENAPEGDIAELRSGDYIFVFQCDCLIALPKIKEFRRTRQYGDLIVSGKCDSLDGKRITDYKLIIDHQVEGEQYMDSYQWRFYLDIFDADVFDYLIFEAHEEPNHHPEFEPQGAAEQEEWTPRRIITIRDIHKITQFRYPELHQDCTNLAAEFYDAAQLSPDLRKIIEAGTASV